MADPNPYFHVKDWGRTRGYEFDFEDSYGRVASNTSIRPGNSDVIFHVQIRSDPQYVLSVNSDDPDGPLIVKSKESDDQAQIWRKVIVGKNYALVNKSNDMAVQSNGADQPLTLTYFDKEEPNSSCLFRSGVHRGEGYGCIMSAEDTDLTFDISEQEAANGVNAILAEWQKTHKQMWRFIPAGRVYTIRPRLDIAFGLSTENRDARGGLVLSEVCDSTNYNTLWCVEVVGPREVRLINGGGGYAAKRYGHRRQIEQGDPDDVDQNLHWIIGEDEESSKFYPLHPKNAMEESAYVNGSRAHKGCHVRTVNYGKGDDQVWGFFPLHSDTPVDPLESFA